MLSEQMQEKYDEAFDAFTKCFAGSKIIVRHRSIKKQENHTNQDISFCYNDRFVFGVYIAKKGYKLYLNDEEWHSLTTGEPSDIKEDGWYSVMFDSLDKCIADVKHLSERVTG